MKNSKVKIIALIMWIIFEIVAVVLWLSKDNIFYLLNFSYIGTSIALGLVLMANNNHMQEELSSYLLVHICWFTLDLLIMKICR